MSYDIRELTKKVNEFRDARDWKQFHNPKDMALSLCLEAAEVLEHFQWKNGEALNSYVASHKEELGDELSDVLFWVLQISSDLGIDIGEAFMAKLEKNAQKYPVEKSKGKATKYTEL